MPDYVVYSTSNTRYQRWQCELLEHSFRLVSQPGQLVCLCSASEHGDDPGSRESRTAQVIDLPSYMHDSATGDFWGIANKFMSLRDWVADESLDGSVLLLDPDMVFLEPVELSVEPGRIIAQHWPDPGTSDDAIFDRYCRTNRGRITADSVFMYPYLTHVRDIRRTITRYIELCRTIRAAEMRWESDMFALVILAAEFGLDVSTRDLGVCNNWGELSQRPSPIAHFPNPFLDEEGRKIWFKQDFTANTDTRPWRLGVPARAARNRAEYSVLHSLENCINEQKLVARQSDFLYWRKYPDSDVPAAGAEPRYLVFDPWPGGFNNIRMSLELAATLAVLLERVLVLPPRRHFYLLEGESTLADFFDVTDPGLLHISFEEFARRFDIEGGNDAEGLWRQVAAVSRTVDWDVVEGMICVPRNPSDSDYLERYRAGRPMLSFDDEMLSAQVLSFPQNLLGNFYLTIYAGNRLDEMTAYVARHIHYRTRLFLEACNVIDHLGDGAYAAIHIRRNDFQYRDLFISGDEILHNVRDVLREGETLYVATDADDTAFLEPLRKRYEVVLYRDVEHLVDRHLHSNLVGCLEQLICTRARVFIGTRLSTFSSYIYRLRGYMNDVADKRYYDNTRPCLPGAPESSESPSWANRWQTSWAREYPEAWGFAPGRIFVSVASYRDPDLSDTVRDLLETAEHPHLVTVGVCMQDTEQNLREFEFGEHPQVRFLPLAFEEARGPCYARSLIQRKLLSDEHYYLQVDSHSRFAPGWDTVLRRLLAMCPSDKPILSTYPNAFTSGEKDRSYLDNRHASRIVYRGFHESGYLHVVGTAPIEGSEPVPSLWLAAGFVFTLARWVEEVPYDPRFYFRGEEDGLVLRSYTHGWDLFAPPDNVVYHDYADNRAQSDAKVRPLHWDDHEGQDPRLDLLDELRGGLGLGDVRSLSDFEAHFGVDFATRTVQESARRGMSRGEFLERFGEARQGEAAAGRRIFVALAAYREPELDMTIRDCIEKADYPGNLRFGICLQFDPDGPPETRASCIDHWLDDDRFRIEKYPYSESQGGCWARHIVQQCYSGEEYTLQVDAHTRFRRGWDTIAIDMLEDLPSAKPLITGFPPLYFRENGAERRTHLDDPTRVSTTVAEFWSPEGWIHHPSRYQEQDGKLPRRTRFLSGGFVFTTGDWNVEVMQDPEHYYTGEEFALTLRSYTCGYDLFSPTEILVWHRCHPEPNPKHFSDFDSDEVRRRHERAVARLRALMHDDPDEILGQYGLGNERTLRDYHSFSGLNCETYYIHPDAVLGRPPDPETLSDDALDSR